MCNQCAKSTGNDSDANRTIAAMPSARLRRNVFQTWDGGRRPFAVYFEPAWGKCKRRGRKSIGFRAQWQPLLLNAMSRKAEESPQSDGSPPHPATSETWPISSATAQLGGFSTDRRCHDATRSPVADLTTATHRLAFWRLDSPSNPIALQVHATAEP
jgi:hypothetical protein